MRWLVFIGLVFVLACRYDAPPSAVRVEPEGGVYKAGDSIEIRFSEPVDESTLAFRLWAGPRDIEGAVVTSDGPLLALCYLDESPCGDAHLSLDEVDSRIAWLSLNPAGLGAPNTPLILEIVEGLSDRLGNATGRPYFFDFQFLPSAGTTGSEVAFQNGTYVFVSTLQQPIPGMVLTLITNVVSDDKGRLALTGADGDEKDGAPKNTTNPNEMVVDSSDRGFVYFAQGELSEFENERFFETQPFELVINLGPIQLVVNGVVMSAKITTDAETGHDGLQGTLSWQSLTLTSGGTETPFPAGSAPFEGVYFEPDSEPLGVPKVCGDLCGSVPTQCDPPADFPPAGMCAPNNIEQGDE